MVYQFQKGRFVGHAVAMCVGLVLLSACATTNNGMVFVPSENYNTRVNIVVLHYTVGDFQSSLQALTKPSGYPVSSHYLVPDPGDKSYTKRKLVTHQLVKETDRAWHAGSSYWQGKTTLNDMSIGIEVVNQAQCKRAKTKAKPVPGQDITAGQVCTFPQYPEAQIELVLELLAGIAERNPDIHPTNYVGHADIAPNRKLDPGPQFPWKRLADAGFGAWFNDEQVAHYRGRFEHKPLPIANVQQALHIYGYRIERTGVLEEQTRNVLKAFQMHFHPSDVSGKPSPETMAKLFALIEKYQGKHLERLLVPIITSPYPAMVSP